MKRVISSNTWLIGERRAVASSAADGFEIGDTPNALLSAGHDLQEVASHTSELEAQVRKLAQELSEYKAESKELKNQDGTIRRLEERIRSLEAQLQEKVSQRQCHSASLVAVKYIHTMS